MEKTTAPVIIVDLYNADNQIVREGITFHDLPGTSAVVQAQEFAKHHKSHGRIPKGRTPKAVKVKK